MMAHTRGRFRVVLAALAWSCISVGAWGQTEDLRSLFGNFETFVLGGQSLRPDALNSAFRTYYATHAEPDWASIVGTDVRDYLNLRGLPQVAARAALFKTAAPRLAPVAADAVEHALDPLKKPSAQRSYYDALQTALRAAGASVESYGASGRDINLLRLAAYASSTAGPVAPPVQMMHQTLRNSVLTLAVPELGRGARPGQPTSHIGLFGLKTTAGVDAFYSTARLKGYGEDLESYGLAINEAVGDRFRVQATVPVFHQVARGHDQNTYGGDVSLRYNVWRGLSVGAHGNYLGHEGDFPADHTWVGGAFVAYTHRLSDTYVLSGGVLADRVAPRFGLDTWVGAAAVNLGVYLKPEMVLNGYHTYFRDFDAPGFAGKDWHDVGGELVSALGKSGTITLGAKTALGYAAFGGNWQVYGSIGWRF